MSRSEHPVDPFIQCGVARGRALFNRGDHWGAHEALERAWHAAQGPSRVHLQGLIQAAAAFHKLVVQDNPIGAHRLVDRALTALSDAPSNAFELAIGPLRAELEVWHGRLPEHVPIEEGRVVGIPRIEWSRSSRDSAISIDTVGLHQISIGGRQAILIELCSGELSGWGECRVAWRDHGVWNALSEALAPAIVAESFHAPSELGLRFGELAAEPAAVAGIEAAAWDLWSQRRNTSLRAALGIEPRTVHAAIRVRGSSVAELREAWMSARSAGRQASVLHVRPNADRRVLQALTNSGLDIQDAILDLGSRYRPADAKAIQAIDALSPLLIARPYPATALHEAARLRTWLNAPLATGPFSTEREADSARRLGSLDAILIEPLSAGPTRTQDILEMAETHEQSIWLVGTAISPIGVRLERIFAMHPACALPPLVADERMTHFERLTERADAGRVESAVSAADVGGLGSSGAGPPAWWLQDTVRRTWTLRA